MKLRYAISVAIMCTALFSLSGCAVSNTGSDEDTVKGTFDTLNVKDRQDIHVVPDKTERMKENNYLILQCDSLYADQVFGSLKFVDSGCGICSLCNAVYQTCGEMLDPMNIAQWAYENKLYNAPGTPGSMNALFPVAAQTYGKTYGFTCTSLKKGTIDSQELRDHLEAGGIAVINVPSHLMVVSSYLPDTDKFFVIDSMPGDVGRHDLRRQGYTETGGNWVSADVLKSGNMAVSAYCLFSKI